MGSTLLVSFLYFSPIISRLLSFVTGFLDIFLEIIGMDLRASIQGMMAEFGGTYYEGFMPTLGCPNCNQETMEYSEV